MRARPEGELCARVAIRKAVAQDAEAVAQITDEAYAKYVPLLGRRPQPMTADHRKMILENEVWLLLCADAAAGVLVLVNEPNCVLIYNVAIRPELQKQGLGRRLLDWAEQEARRSGCRRIRLYTNALMRANIALYEQLGYRETEREPYMGSTRVHMSKWIEGEGCER
jgi:GNAT superfamily N-acetyltransferase